MPDIFDLIAGWWKRMLAVVLLSLLVVGVITFLKPRKYLSVATALPVSTVGSDKSKIFNENIQYLYAALGSPDELDRIIGTANLDTTYIAVAEQMDLFDHYKIKKESEDALVKTAATLKANTKVIKSKYGELQVKVWDTDKTIAPKLANALMEKLQAIHTDLQNAGNEATLKGLIAGKTKIELQADNLASGNELKDPEKIAARKEILSGQIRLYEKLIGEYQLVVDNKAPMLIIVEKAKPALRPDKPRRMQIMIATAVLSSLFALLAALAAERRKNFV